MTKTNSMDELDLETISGRLAYAIKTKGTTFVSKNTNLSLSQVNRIAAQNQKTTLENAADISMATDFELKWIALGEGPMMSNKELWEQTDTFTKIPQLDENQNADFSFDPEFLEQKKVTAEQCLIWEVDCHAVLAEIKRDYTVLIDTQQTKGTGTFVLESNGHTLVGDLHINLDGSARFTTDINNPNTDQLLTKEQLENLNIVGRVIWYGAQS